MRRFYWLWLVFARLVGEKWLQGPGGHRHRMHYGSGKSKEFQEKKKEQHTMAQYDTEPSRFSFMLLYHLFILFLCCMFILLVGP